MTVVRASMIEGTFLDKFGGKGDEPSTCPPNKIKISDTWQRYLASQTRPDSGKQTLIQYEYQYERFADWVGRTYPDAVYLCDVTNQIAEQFASHLASTRSASTFNKYRNLLRMVFRVLSEGTTPNPWQNIRRKKHCPNSRLPFTRDEIAAIFGTATGEMKTLVMIGYYTALRLGDACLLPWSDIDWEGQRIHHKVRKTGRNVTIPLHHDLYCHLHSVFEHRGKSKYICPQFAGDYIDSKGRTKDTAVKKIGAFLQSCGIRTQREGTGPGTGKRAVVTKNFHSFRHTWVSTSQQNGTDRATVQALVGWGNPQMEQVYTHVSSEHLAEAVRRIPSVVATEPQSQPSAAPSALTPLESMSDADLKRTSEAILRELQRRQRAS